MPTPVRLQQNPIHDRIQRLKVKLCVECKERRPLFFGKGRKWARRDPDHKMCLRCFRALENSVRPK